MKGQRWLKCAAICALALSLVKGAYAAPRIELSAPDPPTCVSADDVRSALGQAGVVLAPSGKDSDRGGVHITVRGTPDHLSVELLGGGRDGVTPLGTATCATASDVVSAFLISTLAPAMTLTSTEPVTPAPSAVTVEDIIRNELDRRGIQLAKKRVTLAFEKIDPGDWSARVQLRDGSTVARISLGHFDELSAAGRAAIVDRIVEALETGNASEVLEANLARRNHLRHVLDEVDRIPNKAAWLAAGEVFYGGSLSYLLWRGNSTSHFSFATTRYAFLTTAAGLAVLGGTASFFVDDDYRSTVVGVSAFASVGAFFTGLTLNAERDVPSYSPAALAAGSYATAALIGVNAALLRPPVSRLRATRRDLSEGRASDAEIQRAEEDLAALDTPIPPLLTYGPLLLGGAISILPAIASHFSSRTRNDMLSEAFALEAIGLNGVLSPSYHAMYQRELQRAGLLDVAVGPGPGNRGGLLLFGRF